MKKWMFVLSGFYLLAMLGCKKEGFITGGDASLHISTDSIRFDTLFTATGSITQSFKIRNDNEQALNLSQIKLMGSAASAYRININGVAANELNNVAIPAGDSIYVFVSATINPTAANLPFIISDSISIQYNGNQRWVQLEAYGQNAHFINGQTITGNSTWANTKPYVILDYLHIAAGATLTIAPGTRVYAHANAPIIVDGTLHAMGTAGERIVFAGDRLDAPYKDYPAAWPGIIFRSSSINNIISFTTINNAYQAVVLDGPATNSNPKLRLQQCIIHNAYDAGILANHSSVDAANVLLSNSGHNIALQGGGTYNFIHCTAASYSNQFLLHKTPVLSVFNYTLVNGSQVSNPLQASFVNCIFWGDEGFVDNEIQIDRQGNSPFNVSLAHCLYRAQADPALATLTNNIKNQQPLFDSMDVANKYFDFRLSKFPSPAIDAGIATPINTDLDNHARPVGLPDIGCYEKQ